MLKWVPYALIRVTLFYVLGILLAIYQESLLGKTTALKAVIVLSFIYLLFWWSLRRNLFEKYNLALSVVGFSIIFLLGFVNLKYSNQSLESSHILNQVKIEAYSGTIVEPHYQTDKTNRYLISIDAIRSGGWKQAKGRIYLYVNKDHKQIYTLGNQLIVHNSPRQLSPPMNPGEFNYKRFLSFQNVYHQDYSTGRNIEVIGYNPPNWFLSNSNAVRGWAVERLQSAIPDKREQTIALALILGVKDGLTDEIKNAYSASGAMHVLAVSGLHVGIIYFIVLLVFGRLQNNTRTKWLLALISLITLWFYAAVTGFSPSVLRAVTMFSFIALAKASGRTTNIYNTLAASGLILLIFNPYLIMSVGFQLSYLAVIGIVYFQPKIYSLFISQNKLLDKIWAITSVSLAAQLSTFALGMLYFHQFPTFFLLSNLVVIPGAFLILIGGLIVLAMSFSSVLFLFFGMLLSKLIYIVNFSVFWIKGLPNSLIQDIYIDTFQTWLIIIAILSMFFLIELRKISYLYLSFLCLTALIGTRLDWLNQNMNKKEVTFYRINGHLAIDLIEKGKSILISDSALWSDADKKRFHIIPNQLRSAISLKESLIVVADEKPYAAISWNDLDMLIVKGDIRQWEWNDEPKFDVVILAQNFKGNIQQVKSQLNFDKLILDGSLRGFVANRLLSEVEGENLPVYSVYHDGAQKITL